MAKTPKKDLNLYALVAGPKKSTVVKKGALFTVLGIVAVVALGGSYAGIKIYSHTLDNSVEDWEEKANDTELQEKIANANAVAAEISVLRTASGAYESVRLEIDSSVQYTSSFTQELVERILSCETYVLSGENSQVAVVTALSYDNETLSITAGSTNSRYASFFVQNLTKLGIFDSVNYTGYTSSEGVYTYTVTVTFPEYEATDETTEETIEEGASQ